MSLLLASSITITAPASVDGRGEIAVLNNSASGNFVGNLLDRSGFGGAAVRTSIDDVPEGHGAIFGSFYNAHRSFTLQVLLSRSSTYALSDARYTKLCRAWDAKGADGSISWPGTDGITKFINFRQEQPPGDPDADGKVLLTGVTSDPRIYASTATTGSSPTTNAGNTGSPPTFTLTPTGGNVVITNTTTGRAVTLIVGAGYVTTGGGAVTVNFKDRTISQGGVFVPQAELFPNSDWWEIVPGSNSWTVTNASSVSISVRSAWSSG